MIRCPVTFSNTVRVLDVIAAEDEFAATEADRLHFVHEESLLRSRPSSCEVRHPTDPVFPTPLAYDYAYHVVPILCREGRLWDKRRQRKYIRTIIPLEVGKFLSFYCILEHGCISSSEYGLC